MVRIVCSLAEGWFGYVWVPPKVHTANKINKLDFQFKRPLLFSFSFSFFLFHSLLFSFFSSIGFYRNHCSSKLHSPTRIYKIDYHYLCRWRQSQRWKPTKNSNPMKKNLCLFGPAKCDTIVLHDNLNNFHMLNLWFSYYFHHAAWVFRIFPEKTSSYYSFFFSLFIPLVILSLFAFFSPI